MLGGAGGLVVLPEHGGHVLPDKDTQVVGPVVPPTPASLSRPWHPIVRR